MGETGYGVWYGVWGGVWGAVNASVWERKSNRFECWKARDFPLDCPTMKTLRLTLLLATLTALGGGAFGQLVPRGSEDVEYREFTGSNGKKIKAELIDKTEDKLKLRLPNGKIAVLSHDKLSEEDQEFVRNWSKEKQLFLTKCKSLTIRELLEVRGYESFKFQLRRNHIFIDGELNGNKATFMIDTGAGSTVLHVESAKKMGCEVGPMDQVIVGIGGEAPAALTGVGEIKLGESVIKKQTLLSADMFKDIPGARKEYDAIFGAEFMSRLRTVISYKEGRIFLRPDLVDSDDEIKVAEPPKYRLFKTKDGKVRAAKIAKKNAASTELNLVDRAGVVKGKITLPNGTFSDEDQQYITAWSPQREVFAAQCRGLSVQDILELRKYQSFEYKRAGNHIFVDGKLNDKKTRFMIDTGAGTSVLHADWAKEAGCAVGPMDQKVFGIGGEAPAAITGVPSLEMGRARFENRRLMSVDLFKQLGNRGQYGGIFGADFLRETDAVITYREQKVFLQPDA